MKKNLFALLTAGLLWVAQAAPAQPLLAATPGPLARFSLWRPKVSQAPQLETGYRQHLGWHRAQRDPWAWYGWTVVSGPRYGWLIDATFGHAPADFDHAVDPAGDNADNAVHVFPFGDYQGNFTLLLLPAASTPGPQQLTAAYLRTYYLTPARAADMRPLLEKLRAVVARSYPAQPLYCYQWLDGGALPQFLLLLPFATSEASTLPDKVMAELEALDTRHVVQKTVAETLRYRAELSYFP